MRAFVELFLKFVFYIYKKKNDATSHHMFCVLIHNAPKIYDCVCVCVGGGVTRSSYSYSVLQAERHTLYTTKPHTVLRKMKFDCGLFIFCWN